MSEENKKFLNLFFWLVVIFALVVTCIDVVFADNGIYCPFCKKHLYTYKGDLVKDSVTNGPFDINKFVRKDGKASEIREDIDIDRLLVCPYDSAPLNGYLYWAWAKKYNLPKMVYPAYTFYSKIKKEFVWIPTEVKVED